MRKIAVRLVFMALLASGGSLAVAHHSFFSEYDRAHQVTLKGVVTAVDWLNPHSYLYLDVRGPDGQVTNWAMEGFPPSRLEREGWKRDTLKPGDTITIKGYVAYDGKPRAHAYRVDLPNGKQLYWGVEAGRRPK